MILLSMIRAFCPARSTHKKTKPTEINAGVPIICRIQQKTPALPLIPRRSWIMNAGRKTVGGKGVIQDNTRLEVMNKVI